MRLQKKFVNEFLMQHVMAGSFDCDQKRDSSSDVGENSDSALQGSNGSLVVCDPDLIEEKVRVNRKIIEYMILGMKTIHFSCICLFVCFC